MLLIGENLELRNAILLIRRPIFCDTITSTLTKHLGGLLEYNYI